MSCASPRADRRAAKMAKTSESLIEELMNNDLLIDEVQKRPALYDRNIKEYGNTSLKLELWHEVTIAIFPQWPKFTQMQRNAAARIVNRRWKNLRTCFSRELRERRNGAEKRRKYIYFEQLKFLLSSMENNGDLSLNVPKTECDESIVSPDLVSAIQQDPEPDAQAQLEPATSSTATQRHRSKRQKRPFKEVLLQDREISQYKQNELPPVTDLQEKQDSAALFLLSLAPRLRALPSEQMLDAQIEILEVFKRFANTPLTTSHIHDHLGHQADPIEPTTIMKPEFFSNDESSTEY